MLEGANMKSMKKIKHGQEGYTLFIVLMMMLVIAFVVISNMQATNTEMRISSNDADRKFAFVGAENALNAAEQRILDERHDGFSAIHTSNPNNCVAGLCGNNASQNHPVWSEEAGQLVPSAANGTASCSNGASATNNSCYVIERMGNVIDGQAVYRVTARSWGQNANTVVTLQSFVDYQE